VMSGTKVAVGFCVTGEGAGVRVLTCTIR